MKPMWKVLIMLSCLAMFAGCADDKAQNDLPDSTDSDATGDTDGTGGTDIEIDGGDRPCQDIAGEDKDGDGIPNGVEDKNLNCIWDEGTETNWDNADTDGDGLSDGDEDVNRNGIKDDNEINDPLNGDSNGNGVPDGDEPSAIVCTPAALGATKTVSAVHASTSMALPQEFNSQPQQAASGATFSNGSNVFGYVVQTNATSQNVAQENGRNIGAVAGSGNLPTNRASQQFDTWSNSNLPARKAIRNELLFAYGNGSPNDSIPSKDPAELRDDILSAISGSVVDSGETGTPCANIVNNQVAILRTDGTLVTAGVLTCEDNLATPATDFLFTDFSGATVIAPNTFNPDDFNCEDLAVTAGGGQVDFIWVVDNSGSMADEQEEVARTAETFLQTLIAAGVDWRLGVTTTEAYRLQDPSGSIGSGIDGSHRNEVPNWPAAFGKDELVKTLSECSYCGGFRGVGFMTFTDDLADVRNQFNTYITADEGCDRNGILNANICGDGGESGLLSAVFALTSAVAIDPTESEDHERHYLRPDATRIVVFISDEEDQIQKEPNPNYVPGSGSDEPQYLIYAADDPRRTANTNSYIQTFRELNVVTAAIVGDVGKANGGICDPLDPNGVEGAEHGLAYIDVSTALGGVFGSICNPNLQATIDAIIDLAIGFASNFQLSDSPIASSIKVAVDDAELPRSRTNGWDYNADQNAIVFFGVSLNEGSRVSVSYKKWQKNDN